MFPLRRGHVESSRTRINASARGCCSPLLRHSPPRGGPDSPLHPAKLQQFRGGARGARTAAWRHHARQQQGPRGDPPGHARTRRRGTAGGARIGADIDIREAEVAIGISMTVRIPTTLGCRWKLPGLARHAKAGQPMPGRLGNACHGQADWHAGRVI